MDIKKGNLIVCKSIFGKMRKLNSALYITVNAENGMHKIINIHTNQIIGEIHSNGYNNVYYKWTKGMRPDFAVVYDPAEDIDKRALYIFDRTGTCIFRYKETISYLPESKILNNGKVLICLKLRWLHNKTTNELVYDDKNSKVERIINNVTDIKVLGNNEIIITCLDENNKFQYEKLGKVEK